MYNQDKNQVFDCTVDWGYSAVCGWNGELI